MNTNSSNSRGFRVIPPSSESPEPLKDVPVIEPNSFKGNESVRFNSSMSVDELREQLAAIEHERWADWQKWVHSVSEKMFNTATGKQEGLMIPQELVERWERQINTPYSGLSEQEKASDIEQVDRYWNLIHQYVTKKQIEALKQLKENSEQSYVGDDWWADENVTDNSAYSVPVGYLDDRIKELEKQLKTEGGK